MVEIVGLQGATLDSFDPYLCHLLAQLGILNPVDLRPKSRYGLSHTGARWELLRLSCGVRANCDCNHKGL
jgi:hypothetical protein